MPTGRGMCGESFPVPRPEVSVREFLSASPSPQRNICPYTHPHGTREDPQISNINKISMVVEFGESARTDYSSPIATPKCLRGNFCLHPLPPREKISVFGAPNGAISAGIHSDRCKLTSLL
ncbi:hypothetical protein L195_g031041 [Trifolium pratense]|uniref:Uncharacterized protein n=1 Tax=Trifolium pratense TaxID=57577 RepID=A0A2K3L997_TRIPR|nr:hypothetical protein L195_g031041 [Trifolium pratense]